MEACKRQNGAEDLPADLLWERRDAAIAESAYAARSEYDAARSVCECAAMEEQRSIKEGDVMQQQRSEMSLRPCPSLVASCKVRATTRCGVSLKRRVKKETASKREQCTSGRLHRDEM